MSNIFSFKANEQSEWLCSVKLSTSEGGKLLCEVGRVRFTCIPTTAFSTLMGRVPCFFLQFGTKRYLIWYQIKRKYGLYQRSRKKCLLCASHSALHINNNCGSKLPRAVQPSWGFTNTKGNESNTQGSESKHSSLQSQRNLCGILLIQSKSGL